MPFGLSPCTLSDVQEKDGGCADQIGFGRFRIGPREECHRQEFLKQALGLCNFEKDELAKCIHHTRLNDANERIKRSRERQKEYEKRRREREEEMYGKNNYLKKMIEQEAAKKTGS